MHGGRRAGDQLFYSDGRVGELLGMETGELRAARRELVEAGLVAYSRPFYQVLSLEAHKMEREEREEPAARAMLRRAAGTELVAEAVAGRPGESEGPSISEFLRQMKAGLRR